MWRDLRYAFRSLRRSPFLSLSAIAVLGVAIAANATIISLVDGLWLRPAGVASVGRTVRVFSTTPASQYGRWSFPEYTTLRDGSSSFAGVVACGRRGTLLRTEAGDDELALVNVVSLNFFEVLGVNAERGRLFGSADAAGSAAEPIVVLGHGFWRRHFGGDAGVVGRTLRIGGGSLVATVIGVLPSSFRELDAASDRDLWLPPATWAALGNGDEFSDRRARWFDIVAIRRPGMTVGVADAEMKTIAANFARDFPDASAGRSARVISDFDYRSESAGANAVALVALALFVMVITGVNVANLLVSRITAQTREFAVRVALGAGRRRLLRQTVAETALLGAAGTAVGVWMSMWVVRFLPALIVQPPGFPSSVRFDIDGRVLAITAVAAVVLTLGVGLGPAWTVARRDLSAILKIGATTSGTWRGRFGSAFIVAQVAVSLALLSAAAVLVRSFLETGRSDLGFSRKPILTAWVPSGSVPPETIRTALAEVSSLPGAGAVAIAIRAPLSLSGGGLARRVWVPGSAALPAENTPDVKFGAVSANYFAVMGIPITAGRPFVIADEQPGEPVIVVNEPFATRFLPPGHAVGALVRLGGPAGVHHRVIGIARATPINRIGEPAEPYFYVPYWRGTYGEVTFLVETGREVTVTAETMRATLKRLDTRLEPRQVVTMAQYLRFSAGDYQATATIAAALGAIGLLLTALGMYVVVAVRTARRTREIGIRVALGATRRAILRMVLEDGGRMAFLGFAIGLPAALMTTQLIRSLLFGVHPWDAVGLSTAVIVLTMIVTAATLVPAWRASRVNPSVALRERP